MHDSSFMLVYERVAGSSPEHQHGTMEPETHRIEKEYHVNETSILSFKMWVFGGVARVTGH